MVSNVIYKDVEFVSVSKGRASIAGLEKEKTVKGVTPYTEEASLKVVGVYDFDDKTDTYKGGSELNDRGVRFHGSVADFQYIRSETVKIDYYPDGKIIVVTNRKSHNRICVISVW